MTTDLDTSTDTLVAALRRHAAAVAAGDEDERRAAGPALVEALHAHGVALWGAGAEAHEELDELGEWLGDADGVVHPEPEPDTRERVALFTRTDLAVTDLAILRAVAAERLAECCGEVFEDVDAAVASPVDAVGHLVGHRPTSLEPDDVERYGLDVLSWTSLSVAVDPDEDEDAALDDPWAPLLRSTEDEADDEDRG